MLQTCTYIHIWLDCSQKIVALALVYNVHSVTSVLGNGVLLLA
jgi:hypothetical protein